MKKPKLSDLKENKRETAKIRGMAKKTKKIKVTFNIDEDILKKLRDLAESSGGKYQTILNQLLKEALDSKLTTEERLEKLESEIEKLKKKVA